MNILVVKQLGTKPIEPIPFNSENVSQYTFINNYVCDEQQCVQDLFDKYFQYNKSPIKIRTRIKAFDTFSQIDQHGDHIWFHTSAAKDYDILIRQMTINNIMNDDTIS